MGQSLSGALLPEAGASAVRLGDSMEFCTEYGAEPRAVNCVSAFFLSAGRGWPCSPQQLGTRGCCTAVCAVPFMCGYIRYDTDLFYSACGGDQPCQLLRGIQTFHAAYEKAFLEGIPAGPVRRLVHLDDSLRT